MSRPCFHRHCSAGRSAVEIDEVFDDREPQSKAAVGAHGGGIGLAKALEDMGDEFRQKSFAGISDLDFHHPVDAANGDENFAAGGREFDGVGEEVPKNLLNSSGVGGNGAGGVDDFFNSHLLHVGGGLDGGDGGIDGRAGIDGSHVEAYFSADDAGSVKEVFDQLGLEERVAFDDLNAGKDLVAIVRGPDENLPPAENGIERGAKLVRDGCEKIIFHAVAHSASVRAAHSLSRSISRSCWLRWISWIWSRIWYCRSRPRTATARR